MTEQEGKSFRVVGTVFGRQHMHLLNVREAGIVHLVVYLFVSWFTKPVPEERTTSPKRWWFSVDVLTPWEYNDVILIKR